MLRQFLDDQNLSVCPAVAHRRPLGYRDYGHSEFGWEKNTISFGKEHHGPKEICPNASSRIRSSGMTSSRGSSRFVRVKIKPAGISPQLLGTWRPKIWRTRMRSPKGNCLVSFHSWISILLPVYPQNWPTLNSLILLKVNTLLFCYTFNMEMCTNQLQMQGM